MYKYLKCVLWTNKRLIQSHVGLKSFQEKIKNRQEKKKESNMKGEGRKKRGGGGGGAGEERGRSRGLRTC